VEIRKKSVSLSLPPRSTASPNVASCFSGPNSRSSTSVVRFPIKITLFMRLPSKLSMKAT
jgi:hypothetical protein